MHDDDPGAAERRELLRKLSLAQPDSQRQPVVIESAAGVILIGDHNTVHVIERSVTGRKKSGNAGS